MNYFCGNKNTLYICTAFANKREHSSAGSEHLPYKQGVTGSNPVVPTDYQTVTRLQNLQPSFV